MFSIPQATTISASTTLVSKTALIRFLYTYFVLLLHKNELCWMKYKKTQLDVQELVLFRPNYIAI
jgi:hypothetical protein